MSGVGDLKAKLYPRRCERWLGPGHDLCQLPSGHGADVPHKPDPTPVESWGAMTTPEIRQLRRFEDERARGITHDADWVALMRIQRFRYEFEHQGGTASWRKFNGVPPSGSGPRVFVSRIGHHLEPGDGERIRWEVGETVEIISGIDRGRRFVIDSDWMRHADTTGFVREGWFEDDESRTRWAKAEKEFWFPGVKVPS
jgi:hypothetical protein